MSDQEGNKIDKNRVYEAIAKIVGDQKGVKIIVKTVRQIERQGRE